MKNRTLLLAVGGLAAAAWTLRGPRPGAVSMASSGAAAESSGGDATVRSDSPNPAERLQAAGLASAADAPGADLLPGPSSAEAKGPGLPEFFRGA